MKYFLLPALGKIIERLKREGKTIVHCHGCYDFLHLYHCQHLLAAKQYGDILVVSVTSDRFVNKGPCRPIFTAIQRADMLSMLTCVDYVSICDSQDGILALNIIKPDIYAKGADYDGVQCDEFEAAKALGAKFYVTRTHKFSTTELVRRLTCGN